MLRFAEMAATLSFDEGGITGAEELSCSGFLASTVKRTHQEMTNNIFRLKTRYHKDLKNQKEQNRALEN